MKLFGILVLTAVGINAGLQEAQAIQIGNCDSEPHRLLISRSGRSEEVIIEPWRNIDLAGPPPRVGVDGEPATRLLNIDYDYCIWRDGLAVQKRNRLMRGRG